MEPRGRPGPQRHHYGRHQHAWDREDGHDLVRRPQLGRVELVCRLEDETRDQDYQDQVRGDGNGPGREHRADRDACEQERNRVGHRPADRDQARDRRDRDERREQLDPRRPRP